MNEPERFWNRVSRGSARSAKELGGSSRKIIDVARRYLTSESTVLDFGCGPGDLTLEIARYSASIHGIDTSSGMIKAALEKARQSRRANASFSHDKGRETDLPANAFTVATAFNVLLYVDDVSAVSRRIASGLRPDGVFLSSTACLGEGKAMLRLTASLLVKLRLMPRAAFFEKSELEALIANGGFEIIGTEAISSLPEHFVAARKTQASARETEPYDGSAEV